MATPSPSPDPNGDDGARPDRGATYGTPTWVKLFGIVAIVLVLLVVIVMLAGGGSHGPGRHMQSGGDGGRTPLVSRDGEQP